MPNSTEALATAARMQLDSQLQLATSIAGSLIDGMEKVAGLNLQAAKASFNASIGNAQHLLSAKDPQEFFSIAGNQAQPQADIALTYGRHFSSITSGAHSDLSRAAEAQISANSRQMIAMIDNIAQLAPAGSEAPLSMLKSAIDNISSTYAQLNKSAKVAIDTVESNMQAASSRLTTLRN